MLHHVMFLFVAMLFASAADPALAQSACRQVDGAWSGTMGGGTMAMNGDTRAVIANCQLAWTLPDGSTNRCGLSVREGQWHYECSRGSRGLVEVSANRLRWRNTFTGNNYIVTVTRSGSPGTR